MDQANHWLRSYGQHRPPASITLLHAGRWSMQFEVESGDLRYICFGQREVLRRIYVAVRDANWNTIPAHIAIREMDIQADSFILCYQAEHQQNNIHFTWDGAITGTSDSTLTFTMSGAAQSTFLRNRIGFCILYPMACAGSECLVEHTDGTITESIFPVEIAPHQPFLDIHAIQQPIAESLQAELRLNGEVFEMEDQRNWTDASYKVYGTPLALPIPVEITAGTRVEQAITLRLIGDVPREEIVEQHAATRFTVSDTVVGRLPKLGLASASHGQPLSEREIERLRLLHLAHLRAEVHFDKPNWTERLNQAIDEAKRLIVTLEIALFLSDQPETDLAALRKLLDQQKPTIARWLLFQAGYVCTPTEIVPLARRYLADYDAAAKFVGGTDAFFVQLNRERPVLDGLDLLTFSLNPQVHAFDNASLVENLAAQAATLASARKFSEGRGVMVSPVTLKLRYNPAALGTPDVTLAGELPAQVDPRQATLFGAGWTLGSLKYLSEGRAESVTYYETTGWLGVMQREHPEAVFEQFPAEAGEVYPLFHVLGETGAYTGGEVLLTQAEDALAIDGLALRLDGRLRVLIANLTATTQRVDLRGVQGEARLKLLDENTVVAAMRDPETYQALMGDKVSLRDDSLILELTPFAVARLDLMIGD